ncbi:hypothetical protein ABTY61_15985 [Kitasatospora sp. NPDC096128]|uniref:hypothetical protein n=1 Tax=Kitasatospora sp. NPDC096128 TaxID=3155547 RepID=UPI00332BB4FC
MITSRSPPRNSATVWLTPLRGLAPSTPSRASVTAYRPPPARDPSTTDPGRAVRRADGRR